MRIEELAHLRDDKRIRFTDEEVNGETVTIVSYMIGEPSLWAIPNAIECRGIVFNSDGDCISRPFHKFFNVGENEQTQPHVLEGMELEVLDKRDGSMLVPVLVGGEIAWKTKKSFYSNVAVEASKHVTSTLNLLAKSLIHLGFTPIFEYTSPFNRVVLDYGSEPLFTLLAVRETLSGEYVSYELLKEMTNEIGVPLIMRKSLSLKECMEISALLEGEEGWCLRDVSTGFYCKQKTAQLIQEIYFSTPINSICKFTSPSVTH